MNPKAMIPLAVAIVLGGIAAFMGHRMLNKKPVVKTEVVNVNVAQIAVAKDTIPAATAITKEMINIVSVPEKQVAYGTSRDASKLIGRVLTVALPKDQPVMDTMLAPIGSSTGIVSLVPDGRRAITLEVNEISGVGGMLVPGCNIDIVTTLSDKSGQMLSKTIVRNLRVLAVGRKLTEQKESDKKDPNAPEAPPARTVTLDVTPTEAELIDLAAHTGTPRLVLRGSRDSAEDMKNGKFSHGITLAELRGGLDDSGGGSLFTRLIEMVSKPQGPAKNLFSDPIGKPTTQPSDVSIRTVVVIRATKEQTVQIERRVEVPSTTVNTDPSEVPN